MSYWKGEKWVKQMHFNHAYPTHYLEISKHQGYKMILKEARGEPKIIQVIHQTTAIK